MKDQEINRLNTAFARIVGEGNVITQQADLLPYLTDWRGRYVGEALAVVRPGSTQDVSDVVRCARENGICIIPQGGNTGMCAGATPMSAPCPAIIVRLDRMRTIRAISPLGDFISVDAGCILAEVQAAAARADRLFPLSLGAEGSCQIGGNLSTNAGGTAALRYGTMRDLALGIEVVLPDGRILDLMTSLRKDSAGYEIRHLFIGAEGTLGIITGATLKLFARPRQRVVALVKLASFDHVLALLTLTQSRLGDRIGAFEVMNREQIVLIAEHMPGVTIPFIPDVPWYVLIEIADTMAEVDLGTALETLLGERMEEGMIANALIAASEAQAAAFWKIRHSVSEASKAAGYVVSHDSVVPLCEQGVFVSEVEQRIRALRPDARIGMHGHIGDGNIHILAIIPPVADMARRVAEVDAINAIVDDVTMRLGGSISAEHGIGYANRARFARTTPPLELELMGLIKHQLDPDNLFNPGKIFAV